jgi:hypothetical protein
MADFVVPKGKEFRFSIKVVEKDSFIPEDITNLDTVNSSIKFMKPDTMVCIDNTGIVIEKVPDDPLADPLTYLNGIVGVTIPSTITALMEIERGAKVDNYYLKPTYQMIVDLVFTDATPSRVVLLDKVYVVPASC